MEDPARSEPRRFVVIWLAVAAVILALMLFVDDWMVYNNTGNDGGGSALWVDVPLTLLGFWLFVVPLGLMAWRVHSRTAKATGLVVAVLIAFAWWGYVSTENASSSGGLRPAQPAAEVSKNQLVGVWGNDPREADGRPGFIFEKSRDFRGYDGCNDVSGQWDLEPASGRVRLSEVITTLAACPQKEDSTVNIDSLRLSGSQIHYETLAGEKLHLKSK